MTVRSTTTIFGRDRCFKDGAKYIRRVANDDAGRGGNGAARTTTIPNEHEAMVAMEIMVRRQIDDGALLHTNAVTADRQYNLARELNASVRKCSVKKV